MAREQATFGQIQAALGLESKEVNALLRLAECNRVRDPYTPKARKFRADDGKKRERRIYTPAERPYNGLFLSLRWRWRAIIAQTKEELSEENGFGFKRRSR